MMVPHAGAPGWTVLDDGLMEIDAAGRITAMGPASDDCSVAETWPNCVVLPGFVDAHLHYPQLRMTGSASGPLLEWLNTTTFPEEARFADTPYAAAVAGELCGALARAGTTFSSIFGSPHLRATDILFEALAGAGLRAQAGITLMDREAPAENLCELDKAIEACRALAARWDGFDANRLRVVITPRFAISCTPDLLRSAGALATELGLPVQTHISENQAEIAFTAELFPDSEDYLGVYEDHGLLLDGTLLGHCIHLSDEEWGRVRSADAVAVHCPDSNFFLGSGVMPLARTLKRGVRVALGSDIGGGRTFSMRRVAARAYDASLMLGERVDPATLLWLATRGGALALGAGTHVGCLSAGYEADLAVVRLPPNGVGSIFDQMLFREDHGPVRATVVRGRLIWDQAPLES